MMIGYAKKMNRDHGEDTLYSFLDQRYQDASPNYASLRG
jgi:hypothetical protein